MYDRMVAGPTVVELARAAVRRLADATPTSEDARDALEVIERTGIGPPYTIALAGDADARTELLNALAGMPIFDPARHDPGRVVMTLRRGAVTTLRVRRRDGVVAQRTLVEPPPTEAEKTMVYPRSGPPGEAEKTKLHPRTEAARAKVAAQATSGGFATSGTATGLGATVAAGSAVAPGSGTSVWSPTAVGPDALPGEASPLAAPPEEARTRLLVRQKPWWAAWQVWMQRLVQWWRAWRTRRAAPAAAVEPVPVGPPRPPPPPRPLPPRPLPPSPGPRADEPVHLQPPASAGSVAPPGPPVRPRIDPLPPFAAAVTAAFADEAVERIFVELGAAPLPEDVVIAELPAGAHVKSLAALGADACVVACSARGFVMTHQLEGALAIVPHVFAVAAAALATAGERVRRMVGFDGVAGALVRIAQIERELAVGRRATAVLSSGCETLDRVIAAAEAGFRKRLDRLADQRIPDPEEYTATALAHVHQTVIEHAHQLMRRALDQLDDTLARYATEWSARLSGAATADELRTAGARLDEESPAMLQKAQAAAHRALIDDLTEHARAHYRQLVSELRDGSSRADAVPSWLTIDIRIDEMTTGTSLGAVAPRLSSLFRSRDALVADALGQLDQRIAKLRQRATANLLDTEPQLEPAVTGTIAVALRAEVERHAAWLEAELMREQRAIDAERAQLAVLAIARDAAAADLRELLAALDAVTAELP